MFYLTSVRYKHNCILCRRRRIRFIAIYGCKNNDVLRFLAALRQSGVISNSHYLGIKYRRRYIDDKIKNKQTMRNCIYKKYLIQIKMRLFRAAFLFSKTMCKLLIFFVFQIISCFRLQSYKI